MHIQHTRTSTHTYTQHAHTAYTYTIHIQRMHINIHHVHTPCNRQHSPCTYTTHIRTAYSMHIQHTRTRIYTCTIHTHTSCIFDWVCLKGKHDSKCYVFGHPPFSLMSIHAGSTYMLECLSEALTRVSNLWLLWTFISTYFWHSMY